MLETGEVKITRIDDAERGRIYYVVVQNKELKIMITTSEERLNRWSIDTNKLFETLLYPEEVLTGHYGRFIAHKRYGTHIVRAVYEYDNDLPVVVTVYYPLATRYFKGSGTYADKILP